MKRTTFPSVLDPEAVGYVYESSCTEWWDMYWRSRNDLLSEHAAQFATCGDGLTQHSGLFMVPQSGLLDWCLSFTDHVLKHPEEAVGLGPESFGLYGPRDDEIEFLKSVRHKCDKRQWFSLDLKKVSSRGDLAFDKRWYQVPEWADGGVDSICSLYWTPNARPAALLNVVHVVLKVSLALGYGPSELLDNIKKQFGEGYDWKQAFDAFWFVLEGFEKLGQAKRSWKCALSNSEKKSPAEVPAAEVAA